MPKKPVPSYLLHKPSGQAYSRSGKDFFYHGKYGTEESVKNYQSFLTRLGIARENQELPIPTTFSKQKTVYELMVLYQDYCDEYYQGDSRQGEAVDMGYALRPVGDLFGGQLGCEFGPKKLKECQRWFIEKNYARTTINHHCNRIKRFFRWCVAEEYIPPSISHALDAVPALRKGRTSAKEPEKVQPVSKAVFLRTLPLLSPTYRAMVIVQRYSGMRPQDVCGIRPRDLKTEGSVWLYLPESHKNSWRDQSLIKGIPQIAQQALQPFLDGRESGKYCFSPQDAWLNHGKGTSRKPHKQLGEKYPAGTYANAIRRAIENANKKNEGNPDWKPIPHWSPNRLRHSILTEISQVLNQQSAQRWAGHKKLDTTAIYTEIEASEIIQIGDQLDHQWESDREFLFPPGE